MKKVKIVMTFIIFGLAFLFHFAYDLLPNPIFSIFFSVNESVWEHMKIIVTPILVGSIIEYFYLKYKKISFNNYIFSYALTSLLAIFIYLIMYLPLDSIFNHSMFIAISVLFITFVIAEIINYYLLQLKSFKYSNLIGIVLIIGIYYLFGYLTYNPIKAKIFYDTENKYYGIKKEE